MRALIETVVGVVSVAGALSCAAPRSEASPRLAEPSVASEGAVPDAAAPQGALPTPAPAAAPLLDIAFRDINPGSPTHDRLVSVRELLADDEQVIVSFYASWCAPCFEELPVLVDANQRDHTTVLMLGLDGDRLFTVPDGSPTLLKHRSAAEATRLAFLGTAQESLAIYTLYLKAGYGLDEPAPLRELMETTGLTFSVPLTFTLDSSGVVSSKTDKRLDAAWLKALAGPGRRDNALHFVR